MSELNPIDQYFAIREGTVKLASEEEFLNDEQPIQDPAIDKFIRYLASARVVYLVHQNNHWICKGYEKHLLFQRLYESALERVDEIAEKFAGLFGRESVDLIRLKDYTNELMIVDVDCIKSSLDIEKQFISIAGELMNVLEETGKDTLGIQDMIPSHVSSAEESIYLLNGLI